MARNKRTPRPRIPPVVVQPNVATLQFSLKHLDTTNPKIPLDDCTKEFWVNLVREIHRYSQFTVDLFNDQNHEDRRHTIAFEETSEPDGFKQLDTDQLAYVQAWQFSIGRERWRVAGFLLDDTFYIVWLDPNHALYAGLDRRA
jgi:hypothetical protein